jgi:hypothetical protein
MKNNKDQLDTLNEIKGLMQRSSRFVSLSGVSGIAAGTVAIIGAVFISVYFNIGFFEQLTTIPLQSNEQLSFNITPLFIILCTIFALALILAIYFSSVKAKRSNIIFFDSMAKRVFINFFIFLFTGGIFCMILVFYELYYLIVAAMLIFYGLTLINISKFTFNENAQLGVIEICLGIFSAFVISYPLLIWTIGFGLLHVIYGLYVYLKYERA